VSDPALHSETVVHEPFTVGLPSNHRLARKSRVALTALANEPFVLPARETVPVFHDIVLRLCREAGFVPHAPHEADHLQMIVAMIAAGAGVGLVPEAARRFKHRVAYRPLHPSPGDLEIAMAWRRDDPSPTLAAFVSEARHALMRSRKTVQS
jgi:DNA-binding transcriptional LysR family regulator